MYQLHLIGAGKERIVTMEVHGRIMFMEEKAEVHMPLEMIFMLQMST